jgi:serine/threonine-protein kinase
MEKVSLRADIRLLRLAIERGLLTWDDLEAVPQPTHPGRSESGVAWGPWVSRLIEAGHLDENALVRLIRQLDPEADEPLPAPEEPRAPVPDNWERYHIFSRLGAGGMGSVFKAFDPKLNRFVALKFLLTADRQHAITFLDEARAQAQVEHPLICQVYEVGEVEGQPYIAMRFIDGRPLVEAAASFPLPTKIRLIQQVADALHAAHQKGLIHRDVKPGNILVTTNQKGELRCIVVDFGLAQTLDTRMGEGTEVAGTPDYLSPEQLQGGPIDHRTDVYSLGAVFYELLTGRVPFSGRTISETLRRISDGHPQPPSALDSTIPRDLDAILLKSLAHEPAARYASAIDLSRDLGRFLAGEPIEAHSAGLGYRALKFVRRHRWVALASALGLATLLAVAALGLHARRQTERRAQLAARFGEQVKEMEAAMRFATLLPAHDTSRQRRELDASMESLTLEMKALGPIAEGPGNYALARANLARGRYELAKEQLERAWASGYQRPEVAVALGEAIGQLYEEATYASPIPRSTVIAQATREELGRVLRDPALLYLRAGSRDTSGLYLQALIAFYEGRYEDAMATADASYASRPWFYEARLLVAKVHQAQGQEASHAGRYEEALADFDRAEAVLRELSDVARSSAPIQIAACRELNQRNETRRALGAIDQAAIDEAMAACDRALALDPEAAEAYSLKARISWRWADEIARHGEDPRPELERAIQFASAAIERNPQSSAAYQNLAAAQRVTGSWQALRGIDPVPALEQAVAAAEAAIERQPEVAIGYNSLGNAHIMLARQQIARGTDPNERVEKAIAAYGKAIELNPLYTPALLNLGGAWTTRADWETELGQDPTASIEQALVTLRRAIEINPNYLQLHNNLGNAYNTLAIARIRRNEDPTAQITAAVESYRRALEISPDYAIGLYNLAFVERLLARFQVQNGLDSSAAESAAEKAIERAIELNPSDPENFTERAELELLRADRALRRESDPGPFVAAADSAIAAARELNSDAPQLLHLDALGRRYLAQWSLARGAPAAQLVSRGLELVDQALALNPKLSDSVALEAVLLKLQARLVPAAERPALARRALARLDEAAAGNPALEFQYRGDRAELERLIAGI